MEEFSNTAKQRTFRVLFNRYWSGNQESKRLYHSKGRESVKKISNKYQKSTLSLKLKTLIVNVKYADFINMRKHY